MAEYVNRNTVLRCIKESRENIDWGQSEDEDAFLHYSACLYRTIASVECIQAADVRPVVKARWIGYPECLKYTNAYSDDHIVCSACEECFSILDNDCERFNYCPNCGAKVEG